MLNNIELTSFQYICLWFRMHIQTWQFWFLVFLFCFVFSIWCHLFFCCYCFCFVCSRFYLSSNYLTYYLFLSIDHFLVSSVHEHRLGVDQEHVDILGSLWSPLWIHAASTKHDHNLKQTKPLAITTHTPQRLSILSTVSLVIAIVLLSQ